MNEIDVRNEMMRLWKDTFHDSDEYVELVFDAYFNPDLVEYEMRDGRIVSAMMAVPYRFGNDRNQLNGLYLCGLATAPEHRGKGIMGGMIERLADRMKNSDFSFMFLIPANAGLERYYKDHGFVNAFYRIKEHYTSVHDFNLEYENILNREDERVSNIKRQYCERVVCKRIFRDIAARENDIEQLISWISQYELSGNGLGILHSDKDLIVAIEECVISGGCVYYCMNHENRITGVAFTSVGDEDVCVYLLVAGDGCSYYRILGEIKKDYPTYGITLCRYPVTAEASQLWSPYFGAALPEAPEVGAVGESERVYNPVAHSEVYGMARILNLHEILKFLAADRSDVKYSILVKNAHDAMNLKEVSEILFRRPDSDPIVEEVLDLPPLAGTINLMLD